MHSEKKISREAASLRQKAIEQLKKKQNTNKPAFDEVDSYKLIHEIEVLQIELKMQNEELQLVRDKAEALSKERDFSNTLIQTSGVFIVVIRPDGKLLLMNNSMLNALGYSIEEVVGADYMTTFVPEEDREMLAAFFMQLIIPNQSTLNKNHVLAKDGRKLLVEWHGKSIFKDMEQDFFFGVGIDITERKLVEEKLEHERSLFDMLMNNIPDHIYFKDKESRFIKLNKSMLRRFGFDDMSGAIGKTDYDVFRDEHAKQAFQDEQTIIRTGKSIINFEEKETWKDGSISWVSTSKIPLRDHKGRITGTFGVSRDITDRKRAEEALRQSEEKYRLVVENAGEGIFITQNGWMQFVNRGTIELLGYSELTLTSNPITEFIHSEDREMVLDRHYKRMMGEDIPTTYPFRIVTQNGIVKWMELHSVAIPWKGNPATLNFINDISDRRQTEQALSESEDKFSKAFQNSPDIIIITSLPDGKIIDVNQSITRILGYNREEIIGKTTTELNIWESTDDRNKLLEKLQQYNRIVNFETIFKKKSGENFTGLISGEIIQLQNMRCFMSVIHDIDERKRMEDKLKESEVRLRELNATKDKFFSIIAHDLKNPFNAIIGFSNILLEQVQEKDYEGIEEYARIIQNSSQRAMDLLMNLMEWSRSQTGRLEFNPEPIEIVALINEIAEQSNDAARQKSIAILRELPDKTIVYADKAMISTILRNLISNAVKFTNPGGQIVISAKQKQYESIISVHDNGVGINKGSIKKLFRIEESYSTMGTQKEMGTGLGLLLCKEFIEKHGGKIWVESRPDEGSTFYFTIPAVR